MKKTLIYLITLFFIIGCNPQKNYIEPLNKIKDKSAHINSEMNFLKIENWYNEKYVKSNSNYDFKNSKNLGIVKNEYSIRNGEIFHKNKIIDSLTIFYMQDENVEYVIEIKRGKSIYQIINVVNNPRPSMYSVTYDKDGNINNYHNLKQISYLPQGNGNLKVFYYGFWDGRNQKYIEGSLKEEGIVKNNFKTGEWKYYNKEGKIDSTKTYTLKDSVDVRFPHCIFNKKEPCY